MQNGSMEEIMKIGMFNSGIFSTILQRNDIKCIACGHSHHNCFEGEFCGIKMCLDACAGYSPYGTDELRELERIVMLKVVDQKWMDHIDAMDELKDGIGLRAYGQQDPVVKYRIEGMDMFDEMILDIKYDVVKMLMNLRKEEEVKREEAAKITGAALQALNSLDNGEQIKSEVNRTVVNQEPKVGRNDLCPCGSGKKYKNCCGRNK